MHACTRSTGNTIHPFFIDLHTRTGKKAKHFRRLYPSTSTICECGLFPAYVSTVDNALPLPFQQLCLICIGDIHGSYTDPISSDTPVWARTRVPGVAEKLWTKSMGDTYTACYKEYYTDAHLLRVQQAAPVDNIRRAFAWLADQGRQHMQKQILEEEDKQEEEEREVWRMVDVDSGVEVLAVQS